LIRKGGFGMKLLITGGSGFIGRNLKEYLEREGGAYELYCPSSKELDCLNEEEVTDYLKKHRFDCVIHAALYQNSPVNERDAQKVLEYNLRFFMNFAKNSQLYGKMYYVGSGAEYDKREPIVQVRETDIGRTIPTDQYGLAKYTIGNIIEHSSNIYNLRLFGVYGKYEYYPTKYISNVCCKAIKGLPLTMRQNVFFDYLWIEDFCRMTEFFLNHEPLYHTYNMVSGVRVSLEEICNMVLKVSEKKLPIYICKEGFAKEYTASNERFMNECPGFSYTPMETAIRSLYHWYEDNVDIDIYKLLY
jgi:GDP-L-fucose synthase